MTTLCSRRRKVLALIVLLTSSLMAQDFGKLIDEVNAIEKRLKKVIETESAQRKEADNAMLQKIGKGGISQSAAPDSALTATIKSLEAETAKNRTSFDSTTGLVIALSKKVDSLSKKTEDSRVMEMAGMLKKLIGDLKAALADKSGTPKGKTADAGKKPDEFKPKAEIGGVVFVHFSNDFSKVRSLDNDGFSVERAYFDLKAKLTENISGRVTLDLSQKDTTTKYMFLKFAYAEYGFFSNSLSIRAGQIETPWTGTVDKAWKYRCVEKSLTDFNKVLSTADLGVAASFKLPGNYGELAAQVLNGNGFKNTKAMEENNFLKDFAARASITPLPKSDLLKGFSVSAGFQYKNDAKLPLSVVTGLLAWENPLASAGVELLAATKKDTVSNADDFLTNGFSVFGDFSLWFHKNAGIFARYDKFEPNSKAPDDASWMFIAGPRYKIFGKHTLALVYQHSAKEKAGTNPAQLLKLVLDAKF
jgi:hypothetical protein